jgi:hypothetical protein
MDLGTAATMRDVQGEVDLSTLDMAKEREFERQFEVLLAPQHRGRHEVHQIKSFILVELIDCWAKIKFITPYSQFASARDIL